jgi:tetratricopeptide (TPR) repeat protein/serine/threonine protein kinase
MGPNLQPPLGELPGGYRLVRFLGRGAYGEVWHAEAPGGVEVAVKIIRRTQHTGEPESELKALHLIKGLRHHNLLALQAFFPLPEWLVIVLELADSSLRQRLRQCHDEGLVGIPPAELLIYLRETAEALDFLHAHELQHRDIKPDNILLLGRHVKVADYGLARLLEKSTLQTATTVGTPAYMAPEICRAKVSQHSDQYSLAISYAELRLGRLPIQAENLAQMVYQKMHALPDLDPLPAQEQQVLLRALAIDPEQRYPSCSEMALVLTQVMPHTIPQGDAPFLLASGGPSTGVPGVRSTFIKSAPVPWPVEVTPVGDWQDEARRQTKASTILPQQGLIHTAVGDAPSTLNAGQPPGPPGRSWLPVGLLAVCLACAAAVLVWARPLFQKETRSTEVAQATAREKGEPAAKPTTAEPRPQPAELKPTSEKSNPQPPPEVKPVRPPEPPPPASLRMPAVWPVTLDAGKSGTLEVKVQRENCFGPIRLEVVGLPARVRALPVVLAADAETTRIDLKADEDAPEMAKKVRVRAVLGTLQAEQTVLVTVRVTPQLRLQAVPQVVMEPGLWRHVPVQVERRKVPDAITLNLEGLPRSVQVKGVWPAPLSPGQNSGVFVLAVSRDANPGTWVVRVRAMAAKVQTETELRLLVVPPRSLEERLKADNAAIQLAPMVPAGYVNRAGTYRNFGDMTKALADYETALRLDPNYAPAFNSRGNAYRVAREYDKAIADLTEAIRLNPRYARGFNDRGFAYYLKNSHAQAIEDFNEALRLDPTDATAYVNRARAYQARGESDRALADLNEAIRLEPTDAAAYQGRGYLHEVKKEYDKAFTDYDAAVRLNPKYAPGYNGRGFIYSKKGDLDKAIADYSEAIKLNSTYSLAYRNRGNAYHIKKDYDRAIADYDTALKIGPQGAIAYRNRGNSHLLKKDYGKAIADFTTAIKLNPNYLNAYALRSQAYRAQGDTARAEEDLRKVKQISASKVLSPPGQTGPPKVGPVAKASVAPPSGQELLRTTAQLTAGDPTDRDLPTYYKVHLVKLAAGQTYVIEMVSEEGTLDPYFRLADGNDKELQRKASPDKHSARITYQAPITGTYRIIATTYQVGQTGRYRLTVWALSPGKS